MQYILRSGVKLISAIYAATQLHPRRGSRQFVQLTRTATLSMSVQACGKAILIATCSLVSSALIASGALGAEAQSGSPVSSQVQSSSPGEDLGAKPMSMNYRQVQQRLARGWNTWDVNSVATYVLLPDALAIHIGLKHNRSESGEDFLQDALIGRLTPDAEQVTPGPHAWDGSYTDLRIAWKGHSWRIQSAHEGSDLVVL